jgi:hypothetical protein
VVAVLVHDPLTAPRGPGPGDAAGRAAWTAQGTRRAARHIPTRRRAAWSAVALRTESGGFSDRARSRDGAARRSWVGHRQSRSRGPRSDHRARRGPRRGRACRARDRRVLGLDDGRRGESPLGPLLRVGVAAVVALPHGDRSRVGPGRAGRSPRLRAVDAVRGAAQLRELGGHGRVRDGDDQPQPRRLEVLLRRPHRGRLRSAGQPCPGR